VSPDRSLGHRLALLELRANARGQRIIVQGGLPKGWRPPEKRDVGGSDLAAEHEIAMESASEALTRSDSRSGRAT
jgi:hypothetical protein